MSRVPIATYPPPKRGVLWRSKRTGRLSRVLGFLLRGRDVFVIVREAKKRRRAVNAQTFLRYYCRPGVA